jgi:hypothetical protein
MNVISYRLVHRMSALRGAAYAEAYNVVGGLALEQQECRMIGVASSWCPPALNRMFSSESGSDDRSGKAGKVWRFLTGSERGEDAKVEHIDSPSETTSEAGTIIPSSPEHRYREVLCVPISRRPLFPGVIMPVMVKDTRVIKELIDIRKQGWVLFCRIDVVIESIIYHNMLCHS